MLKRFLLRSLLLVFVTLVLSNQKIKAQDFYSLNEFYVYGQLGYNFYEGVDIGAGVCFRVPLIYRINVPFIFETNYFYESIDVFGRRINVNGFGFNFDTYYAFLDIGQRWGIYPLEYIGIAGGISVYYEFYNPNRYLATFTELAGNSDQFSMGLNIAPMVKLRFSEKVAGTLKHTLYVLPSSPFGPIRNVFSFGIQYQL